MGRYMSAFFLAFLVIAGAFLLKSEEEINVQSPLPKIFGEKSSFEIDIINDWFPQEIEELNSENIFVTSKSALVTEYSDGRVIYAKNANMRLPAASTIKIMTALVALENSALDNKFTVSPKAASIGEDSMYLGEGETLTLKELLYGMMLVSGNDAAITVAEGIAGSEEKYVEIMNGMSKRLGLKNSEFINVSGLDEDGKEQYTTARDLTTISRYIWETYPVFRDIVSTSEIYIEATENHKDYSLSNDTNLLTSYPGVKGIKPGFTWESGLCLVTIAQNGGKQIISVVLGSEDRRGEMVLLLDYGFSEHGIKVEHPGLDLQI